MSNVQTLTDIEKLNLKVWDKDTHPPARIFDADGEEHLGALSVHLEFGKIRVADGPELNAQGKPLRTRVYHVRTPVRLVWFEDPAEKPHPESVVAQQNMLREAAGENPAPAKPKRPKVKPGN